MDPLDTLCHYTSADAALHHIIPSGELRMSPYARMRDPLENRELSFSGRLPLEDRPEEVVLEELTDLMDDATLRIRRIRNRMLMLSFTVDASMGYSEGDEPFMRAWARARMWEQYACERVLRVYLEHCNTNRPHRALKLHPPQARGPPPTPTVGEVRRHDRHGGLIHEYYRDAA